MNEKLSAIFARRSIRVFQEKEIPEEMIKDILEAAMAAPSAVAKDPWEFIVIKNKNTLIKITEALPNGKMLSSAPLGIIVCGDIKRAHGNELSFLLQDCSAAIQNILLASSILGLGACWLGVHPRTERISYIKEYFKLPENIIPIAAIALGFPAEKKEPRTRFDKEKIHFEKW
ncbi:MAG TPA: nitroreductase family protein [Victivallales bacterium]|nr:nitroreductase family protein [Victivallales bacterium]HPO91046.1 nitroreductase family protein [Victivallales bacterium]HRR29316.1 nitroreductase family protein [Victivallales bacterium]HRU01077.1 nitroreductase family protein [Victivallales bacterium]